MWNHHIVRFKYITILFVKKDNNMGKDKMLSFLSDYRSLFLSVTYFDYMSEWNLRVFLSEFSRETEPIRQIGRDNRDQDWTWDIERNIL